MRCLKKALPSVADGLVGEFQQGREPAADLGCGDKSLVLVAQPDRVLKEDKCLFTVVYQS